MPNKRKKLLLIIPIGILFVAIITMSGYFFAISKNKPRYQSNVDKLMFDTKNKPPKFLLTLPNKNNINNIKNTIISDSKEQEKIILEFDNLKNIPSLAKLPPQQEKTPLEVISKADTKKPWSYYSKSYTAPPNFYKIAVVIRSVGLNSNIFEEILRTMPENISLSFSPYANNKEDLITQARKHGHETYLDLLFGSSEITNFDRGPKTLNPNADIKDTIKLVDTYLKEKLAIGGFITSTATGNVIVDDKKVSSVLNHIKDKGLLFIDATCKEIFASCPLEGLPRYKTNIILNKNYDKDFIKQQFAIAERTAIEKGSAIIVINPKPINLVALSNWISTFSKPQKDYEDLQKNPPKKPFTLVPASSLVSQ